MSARPNSYLSLLGIFAVVLAVVVGCLTAHAQAPQSSQPPAPSPKPSDADFELNSVLMENTFMLEGRNAQGTPTLGTGFILGRPIPNAPGRGKYVLITAAHVFAEMQGDTFILHLRRRANGDAFVKLPVSMPLRADGRPLWISNPNADVAVMYVNLLDGVSLPLISTDLLADDKMLSDFEIHPGDELECLGYPLGLSSNEAGFPILRSGKIASFPLLPTAATKTFLLDFRVFKGNSGGPVYVVGSNRYYGGAVHLAQNIHFIVGLVSQEELFSQMSTGLYDQEIRQLQLGLAVIVHASLIKQTLDMLPTPTE